MTGIFIGLATPIGEGKIMVQVNVEFWTKEPLPFELLATLSGAVTLQPCPDGYSSGGLPPAEWVSRGLLTGLSSRLDKAELGATLATIEAMASDAAKAHILLPNCAAL